jgi:hypothetical protein
MPGEPGAGAPAGGDETAGKVAGGRHRGGQAWWPSIPRRREGARVGWGRGIRRAF